MANLDPQTGQPRSSPVPPKAPPGGIGTGAFPADGGAGEDHGEQDRGSAVAATEAPPDDGGPSSDLTREVSEPVPRGGAGALVREVEEEGKSSG
jgi:hypothetical protein